MERKSRTKAGNNFYVPPPARKLEAPNSYVLCDNKIKDRILEAKLKNSAEEKICNNSSLLFKTNEESPRPSGSAESTTKKKRQRKKKNLPDRKNSHSTSNALHMTSLGQNEITNLELNDGTVSEEYVKTVHCFSSNSAVWNDSALLHDWDVTTVSDASCSKANVTRNKPAKNNDNLNFELNQTIVSENRLETTDCFSEDSMLWDWDNCTVPSGFEATSAVKEPCSSSNAMDSIPVKHNSNFKPNETLVSENNVKISDTLSNNSVICDDRAMSPAGEAKTDVKEPYCRSSAICNISMNNVNSCAKPNDNLESEDSFETTNCFFDNSVICESAVPLGLAATSGIKEPYLKSTAMSSISMKKIKNSSVEPSDTLVSENSMDTVDCFSNGSVICDDSSVLPGCGATSDVSKPDSSSNAMANRSLKHMANSTVEPNDAVESENNVEIIDTSLNDSIISDDSKVPLGWEVSSVSNTCAEENYLSIHSTSKKSIELSGLGVNNHFQSTVNKNESSIQQIVNNLEQIDICSDISVTDSNYSNCSLVTCSEKSIDFCDEKTDNKILNKKQIRSSEKHCFTEKPIDANENNTLCTILRNNDVYLKQNNSQTNVDDDFDWENLLDDDFQNLCATTSHKDSSAEDCVKKKVKPALENESCNDSSIIEIYGFPEEFKTQDLLMSFSIFVNRGLKLKWVDDTHALGIFPSPKLADEALNSTLPFVKTRPLNQATAASKEKAKNLTLPPVLRPKTCSALARRLVSGALGLRAVFTPAERAAEREMLKQAREEKRLAAKQRDAAWEGRF